MEDTENLDELATHEPDLPPEVEVFTTQVQPAAENDFFSDVTQLYLNEIGANPLLTAAEELAIARRVCAGDFDARQIMIERNLRLVVATSPSTT